MAAPALLLRPPTQHLPAGTARMGAETAPRCLQSCALYPSPRLPHKACSAPPLPLAPANPPQTKPRLQSPPQERSFSNSIMCSKVLDIRRTACPFHCSSNESCQNDDDNCHHFRAVGVSPGAAAQQRGTQNPPVAPGTGQCSLHGMSALCTNTSEGSIHL